MLKILRHLIQEVHAASDLKAALSIITREMCSILPTDLCAIYFVDEEKGEYVLMALHGVSHEDLIEKLRVPFGKGLIGVVGERRETLNIPDLHQHPKHLKKPKIDVSAFHGFLGIPLIEQGELFAILIAERKAVGAFTTEETALAMTLLVPLSEEIVKIKNKTSGWEPFGQKKTKIKKLPKMLYGVAGAPGVAIGRAVVVYPPADLDAVPDREAEKKSTEVNAFKKALEEARLEIQHLQHRAQRTLSAAEQSLFDAYLRILDSHSFLEEVIKEIEKGQWAPAALKRVVKRHILHFEKLEDAYMQERAADFRDLGRRILSHLQKKMQEKIEYPKNTILVSEEITATMLMEIPEDCLAAVVSSTGSGNSHVAILARALGLPSVMGCTGIPLAELDGKALIVDGYNGEIYISPSSELKKEFQSLIDEEKELDVSLVKLRDLPAKTKDGHTVQLMVNTGLISDVGLSQSVGADGVGLYRTEIPFMLRDRFPSEEEQRVMYQQLLETFAPKPVIMRTLDVGGDKSLPYFPIEEANPFLGWRGIRIALDYPQIFLQQLRAMLQANVHHNNLSIMFPMITSIREIEMAKQLVRQAHDELREEGLNVLMPQIGLMIEVPAAVYQARELAKRVDFLSVGSNDLIQYMLAVDRNNARVAHLYDGFHPAVVRALEDIAIEAHKGNASVSICGELASDPVSVVLLLGMGYDSLSMNATALPRVKWVIRNFSFQRAEALVAEVRKLDDSREIREHVEMALEEAGLGGLIRAGR